MLYILLFVLIQLVSLALMIVGLPVVGVLTAFGLMYITTGPPQFPRWAWIWANDEDGVEGPPWFNPTHSRWKAFVWSALRNPVSNLRFVRGVSKVGRPLFYRTWTVAGREFYAKAGWMTNGYPCLSAGAGRGF